ncbi:MAG: hypothetical protein Q7T45_09780 [Bradyrhizobium sp.]|uniref:hypothetical protein n=1 Tax=Bradyrhizobium sp. TaxID=376 RepID=UPI00271D30B5|nr:hypothetical protein [Bradyrhizobium sp.]MDO8398096.1 hypothetical protein [Bradyrhizobium sp.]
MAQRPPHIPHNVERTALQNMQGSKWLPEAALYPAKTNTIATMLAKGWIEKQAGPYPKYRITAAGEAALKANIPSAR